MCWERTQDCVILTHVCVYGINITLCVEYTFENLFLVYFYVRLFTYGHYNLTIIHCNLTFVCIVTDVTINMIVVLSWDILSIAQWIGLPALMHEVAGSPLAGNRKCLGALNTCHIRFVLPFPTQLLVSSWHKRVSLYEKRLCSVENKLVCLKQVLIVRV